MLVGLLLAGTACSADEPEPRADPTSSAPTEQRPSASDETRPPEEPGTDEPETEPTSSEATRGVTCLPVEDATARAIAGRSIDPIRPVPGRSVAYRPLGLRGTYLVVMIFTGPGRSEPQMGVWAVRRSIEPGELGQISSVDRIARYVTSWPVARGVVEDDYRVSEVRACTLV
jgi:hypothetical protein